MNRTKPRVSGSRCLASPSSSLGLLAGLAMTVLVGCRAPVEVQSSGLAPGAALTKSVLLVTGEDYQGHRWQETEVVLRRQLGADPRMAVEVVRDLSQLAAMDLRAHAAVVLHFKNYDPQVPGREAFDKLTRYVREGGGLVLVHFAGGAFQEFKQEFEAVAGRVWNPKLRGHDPHGKFRVEILATDHPVTRGMTSFETIDELYTCLDGATPITVLAEATSSKDGKRYPMAFVLRCGTGRVFHCPLGHDVRALTVPDVGALFRRGCAWAAGLEPAGGPFDRDHEENLR